MWRSRLPLGLLVVVASCQPTDDGNENDPLGEMPPISDFPRAGGNMTINPVTAAPPGPASTGGGAIQVSPPGLSSGTGGGPGGTTAPSSVTGSGGAMDAGAAAGPGGAGSAPPPDAGDVVSDAGDGATLNPNGDAGCPRLLAPDSGICSAYGCSLSLDQLRTSASTMGTCSSAAALAAACDGSASSAALRCTEASVFSADLRAGASACVKRDAQLSAVGASCLDCYVDEALCTLSRCFALCALASENEECRACRHKQCAGALSQCTGLPAP